MPSEAGAAVAVATLDRPVAFGAAILAPGPIRQDRVPIGAPASGGAGSPITIGLMAGFVFVWIKPPVFPATGLLAF